MKDNGIRCYNFNTVPCFELSILLLLQLRVSLVRLFEVRLFEKLSFQEVHNEKVIFQKAKCLVKAVKKCFLKKLSVWLVFIKVAV